MIENAASWRKSSRSGGSNGGGGSNCVEVAYVDSLVGLRDSKRPGVGIAVPVDSFRTFIARVKSEGREQ
ncbi:uncharacterized protein DUF397 [Saccharothrix saharensis]|uniref:Uncharacterized protein DUF397 n=1 Tax=Saccharothrix saharensis TaxID=571190 RepID=A0A543JLV2_9PSEU|nr:DUF397 domain-containing protein [Saccharothrix saharensis]TQM83744.1 uncharacterized protein DUF397 [Saccharothrix saharensis]